MNRLKKFLFAGGAAAMLLAGIVLVSAPSAEASTTAPEDCTFCSPREQGCHIGNHSGRQTCYVRISGNGTCPPCTPCKPTGTIYPF